MRILRRVATLVMSLLVLQLMLAGSGYACRGHDVSAKSLHDGMQMDTGEMRVTSVSVAAHTLDNVADIPACDALSPNAPCSVPETGGECQAMGPCAPLILAVSQSAPSALVEWSGPAVALTLVPLTRSTAPELPPPRA